MLQKSGFLRVDAVEVCRLGTGYHTIQASQLPLSILTTTTKDVALLFDRVNISAEDIFPTEDDFVFWLSNSEALVILRKLESHPPEQYRLITACRIFIPGSNALQTTILYPSLANTERSCLEVIGATTFATGMSPQDVCDYLTLRGKPGAVERRPPFGGVHPRSLAMIRSRSMQQHIALIQFIYFGNWYTWDISHWARNSPTQQCLLVETLLADLWALIKRTLSCVSLEDEDYKAFIGKLTFQLLFWEVLGGQNFDEKKIDLV